LDLTPIQENLQDGVKLIETSGELGTYACLSHCWGKTEILSRTTLQNIKDFTRFIPWVLLPKNFQDAITIAQHFGIRYLWIDSLCITQDSKKEWEQESGKMADIYSNSFVTIAAVAPKDSRGGCFSKSTPDKCLRIGLEREADWFVGVRRYDLGGHRRDDKLAIEKEIPLFHRAWVYQERVLSRRILYCHRRELQFECRENSCCECTGHGLLSNAYRPMQKKKEYSTLGAVPGHPKDFVLLRQRWHRIVSDYSKLSLLYTSDKLPALSGCAKETRNISGDKYLAGLWQQDLRTDLLWWVNGGVPRARPTPYHAPTWSWASVDAPDGISFVTKAGTIPSSIENKIEAVNCIPAGDDDTGAVKSGHLRFAARLRVVYLRSICGYCRHSGKPRHYGVEILGKALGGSVNEASPCSFGDQGLNIYDGFHDFHPDDIDLKEDEDLEFTKAPTREGLLRRCMLAQIYLLHVIDCGNRNKSTETVSSYFLGLKKLKLRMDNERIGLFVVTHTDQDKRNEWFKSVWPRELGPESKVVII
jgi:hypothetical protein